MWWMWNRSSYSFRNTCASFGADCAFTTSCPRCTCSSKPRYETVRTRSPASGTGQPACHEPATCARTAGESGRIDEKNGDVATTASAEARTRTTSLFQPARGGRVYELGQEQPVAVGRVTPSEVAGALDDLELCAAGRHRIDHLAGGGHRRDRIELTDAHERRALDAVHPVEHVEALHQLEAMGVQLAVRDRTRALVVPGNPRPEESPARRPFLRCHRGAAVGAFGDRRDLVAAGATEVFDDPVEVESREGRLEHERGRMRDDGSRRRARRSRRASGRARADARW